MESRSFRVTVEITAETDLEMIKKRLRTLQNSLRADLTPEDLQQMTEKVFTRDESGGLVEGRLIEKGQDFRPPSPGD